MYCINYPLPEKYLEALLVVGTGYKNNLGTTPPQSHGNISG